MDEPAARAAVVHVEQWVIHRVVDHLLGLVFVLSLADKHDGDAALIHYRRHVGVVKIDQRRLGDRLGNPLDRLGDDLIHHRKRLTDREVRDVVQQAVVVENDDRVGGVAELFEAFLGLDSAGALDVERCRHHADDDRTLLFGDIRDHWGRAGTGTATHAGGHKDQIGIAEHLFDRPLGHLRGAFAHRGVATRAEALGEGFADEDLCVGFDHLQMLFVGVDCDRLRAVDADVIQSVDRIVARTAGTDDNDPWIAKLVIIVEAGVHITILGLRVVEGVLYDILHGYTFAQLRSFLFRRGSASSVSLSISRTADRIASLRFGNWPVSTISSTSSICCFGIRSVTRSMVTFPGKTVGDADSPTACHAPAHCKTIVLRSRNTMRSIYKPTGRCKTLRLSRRTQSGESGGVVCHPLSKTSAAVVRRPQPGQNAQSDRSSSPHSQNRRREAFSPQFGQ